MRDLRGNNIARIDTWGRPMRDLSMEANSMVECIYLVVFFGVILAILFLAMT